MKTSCLHSISKTSKPFLAYAIKNVDFSSKLKESSNSSLLIYHNFWRNLLNIYSPESVFLSPSNKLSNKYATKLNSFNLKNNYESNYKHLLSEFSKSLSVNNVKSSFTNPLLYQNSEVCPNIEYLWYKGINIRNFKNLVNLFIKDPIENQYQNIQGLLHKNLSFNSVPLYVVSNNLGQMILSESPEDSTINDFAFKSNSKKVSEGWFFVNLQDAQEYLESVAKSYGLNVSDGSLKIFTCNFETFYTLLSKYNNKVSLRLIPDLHEIGNVLKKYRYCHNIMFHHKQRYGKNHFYGQPIYIIKNSKNLDNQTQYDQPYLNKKDEKYNFIFMNYKTALTVYRKLIRSKNLSIDESKKLQKPKLIVYNLEHFLRDQVIHNNTKKKLDNFLLIPSKDSYKYTKNNLLKTKDMIVLNETLTTITYIKLWIKRIFWSLTSKQPVN